MSTILVANLKGGRRISIGLCKNARKRIATCSSGMIGQLLALNVIPVAAPIDPKWTAYYYNTLRTEIQSHLKLTDPYTSWRFEANVERLVHIRPDAIVGTDQISEQDQARLADIAPCCFVPKHASDWRTQLRMIGSFLEGGSGGAMDTPV